MNNVAKVLKVVTATTQFYVVAGRVTLAKCVKTGKFIARADAQWLFDNLASLAVPAEKKAQAYRGTYMSDCEFKAEFTKAVDYFGVQMFCESTKEKILNKIRTIAYLMS